LALPALLDALQGEFYTVRTGLRRFGANWRPTHPPLFLRVLKDPEPEGRWNASHRPALPDESPGDSFWWYEREQADREFSSLARELLNKNK
jgi:hypothetical protein